MSNTIPSMFSGFFPKNSKPSSAFFLLIPTSTNIDELLFSTRIQLPLLLLDIDDNFICAPLNFPIHFIVFCDYFQPIAVIKKIFNNIIYKKQ